LVPSSPLFPFLFHDTPPTQIYTLSLHDALPISPSARRRCSGRSRGRPRRGGPYRKAATPITLPQLQALGTGQRLDVVGVQVAAGDRKSTRLNSSHDQISYAVFCLKKKKHTIN